MQFTAPSQDAGMQASISSGCRNDIALHGEWDTHSSVLGSPDPTRLLGPWHSWGRREDPRLHLKTRPPDL
jgi:hypothetical protein